MLLILPYVKPIQFEKRNLSSCYHLCPSHHHQTLELNEIIISTLGKEEKKQTFIHSIIYICSPFHFQLKKVCNSCDCINIHRNK